VQGWRRGRRSAAAANRSHDSVRVTVGARGHGPSTALAIDQIGDVQADSQPRAGHHSTQGRARGALRKGAGRLA
jgi:hypothetical protein